MPRRTQKRKQATSRIARRRRLGTLKSRLVKAKTLERYNKAILAFLLHVQMNRWPLASTLAALDKQMSDYVEHLWFDGEGKSMGNDTISGVQYHLNVKSCFYASWKLLGVWKKLELPERALPCPLVLALSLAGLAVAQQKPRMCAVILLMFFCLLRPAEACACMEDAFWLDKELGGFVTLPNTKGGERRGAIEMVTWSEPLVGVWVSRALLVLRTGEPLASSPSALRSWLGSAMKILSVEDAFKPYSFRRGGATYHFQQCRNMSETIEKGRWANVATARIYVNEALAQQQSSKLSQNPLIRQYISFLT